MGNVFSASTNDYHLPETGTRAWTRDRIARWFFVLGIATTSAAGLVAVGLMRTLGRSGDPVFRFPIAFGVSTLLLVLGSVTIGSARRAVRWERQALFRRRLLQSVAVGAMFMGVQTYALWTILPVERSDSAASTGVAPFVLMLAALHGLHFLVATLFVSYVTVQAHAGRYDHEYHWGVTVCAGFWHALGIVWGAILAVYAIVVW